MPSNSYRIIQFDTLRVFATFAVVWLHTSAQRFYDCYPSIEWEARNFYDSMVRWAVPIFVMISGSLFLNPEKKIGIKELYTKNIKRIVLIYLFWSIVYGVYGGIDEKGLVGLIRRIVQGPFHFWFLKMIIGLYICVPILKVIVKDKKLEQYFICFSLVTAFVIPILFPLVGLFSGIAREIVVKNHEEFGITIALGHIGYFVLGHYLTHNTISESVKKVIYALGIMSIGAVCILTNIVSYYFGEPCLFLYGYINMFTLFEALALFIVIKEQQISLKYHLILINASKLSLGIYIIHPLVMSIILDLGGIDSASLNPLYFIPVFAIAIFAISYFFTFLLNRTPIIQKFII